jgi:hypothetical protein
MSRAPLLLAAAAIFSASSVLALADGSNAITSAVAKGDSVASHKMSAKQLEHEYHLSRHYRGYDETPSAMIVPARRV